MLSIVRETAEVKVVSCLISIQITLKINKHEPPLEQDYNSRTQEDQTYYFILETVPGKIAAYKKQDKQKRLRHAVNESIWVRKNK